MAQEAGQLELHVWCVTDAAGTKEMLPGSPFPVHVSEGNASAVGSFVKDAEVKTEASNGRARHAHARTHSARGSHRG